MSTQSNKSWGMTIAGVAMILCGLAVYTRGSSPFSATMTHRRLKGGRAYADVHWNQNDGLDVKAGAEVTWKLAQREGLGPVSPGKIWKSVPRISVLQVIPGQAIDHTPSEAEKEVQVQWIGALIRTAKQGGVLSQHVLALNSEKEKRLGDIVKGAVGGAVSGASTGAAAGPKGAAIGAGLGAIGGAVVGGTGGWGRRQLQWGGSHAYTDPSTGRSMNSGGYLTNPRRSDQIRANNAGALTRSEAQRMGLPFRRKIAGGVVELSKEEEKSFLNGLIDEVTSYTQNAIKEARQRLRNGAADIISVFTDDLEAAAAAMRALNRNLKNDVAEKAWTHGLLAKEEKETAAGITFSWATLLDQAQNRFEDISSAVRRWSDSIMRPVKEPETREKIVGALVEMVHSQLEEGIQRQARMKSVRVPGAGQWGR